MIPQEEEFEVFSYESSDVSFTIYMATLGELLSNQIGFMATVYIDGDATPITVTRKVNVGTISVTEIPMVDRYVSMLIAQGLNGIFRQIVLYALPNKYVPRALAERPCW